MLLLTPPLKTIQKIIYNTLPNMKSFNTQKEAFEAVKNLPLQDTDNPKPSIYNYFEEGEELRAVYNTLYCSMAFLSDLEWAVLHNTQAGDATVLNKLFTAGFMVPKETDEFAKLQKYKAVYHHFLSEESPLRLIVPTTTKCNARCAYCFQDNAGRSDMLPGVEEQIKKFVDKNIKRDKKLHISWFGGDPLLNTGLIDRLSSYFLQQGYELDADIITNGSLLTEKIRNVRTPPKINFCMAELPDSYCIEPNGNLKICSETITVDTRAIGNLQSFDPKTDQRRKPSPYIPNVKNVSGCPYAAAVVYSVEAKDYGNVRPTS